MCPQSSNDPDEILPFPSSMVTSARPRPRSSAEWSRAVLVELKWEGPGRVDAGYQLGIFGLIGLIWATEMKWSCFYGVRLVTVALEKVWRKTNLAGLMAVARKSFNQSCSRSIHFLFKSGSCELKSKWETRIQEDSSIPSVVMWHTHTENYPCLAQVKWYLRSAEAGFPKACQHVPTSSYIWGSARFWFECDCGIDGIDTL